MEAGPPRLLNLSVRGPVVKKHALIADRGTYLVRGHCDWRIQVGANIPYQACAAPWKLDSTLNGTDASAISVQMRVDGQVC